MLTQVLQEFLARWRQLPKLPSAGRPRVLNVGGGNRAIGIPRHYDGWEYLLLDIDPRGKPDICCDARNLASLTPAQFDAVYCSHNLEHYYRHDAANVLAGFRHVLKADGFAEIKVPDLQSVVKHVAKSGMDLGDILYNSAAGPIAVLDVIYGFGREIEQSGQDFYAHKNGFTPKLLGQALRDAGFADVRVFQMPEIFELRALAFQHEPSDAQLRLLGIANALTA